jgi:hypothetical protein
LFRKANDQLSFLQRVGSHATKEHATGRIDAIPPNAEQPVEYFNSLHDQYKALQAQYQPLVQEAATYRERLKQTMPYKEFSEFKRTTMLFAKPSLASSSSLRKSGR